MSSTFTPSATFTQDSVVVAEVLARFGWCDIAAAALPPAELRL